MITCMTVGCSEQDVEHSINEDGLPVFCGVCGVEMSGDE